MRDFTHPSMNPPIKVVVVGYGFAGRSFHSYLIGLVPELQLYGVVARNPEARARVLAERPGTHVFPDLDAALADPAVGLVVVATPHDTHHPLAMRALGGGRHVVIDKPMCLNLVQARELVAAAEGAGKGLFVFHNRRWDSEFLTLQHAISTGLLGPAESVRWIEMAWNRFGTWKSWRAKASAGGGRLYDLGSHMLDQILTLIPAKVETVYARAHFDFPDTDTPSHCQVTLRFEGGATGVFDCTSMSRFEKPRMLAMGSEGTFVKFGVDTQEAAMVKGDIDSAVVPPEQWPRLITAAGPRMLPPIPGRWRGFYEHVADVLLRGAQPRITAGQMLRLMSALDAAHESIRTGQAVVPEGI
jgi:scyllo-inositol 2-dehydrogenase (NADP+)